MEHIELDPLNETCRMANDNNKKQMWIFQQTRAHSCRSYISILTLYRAYAQYAVLYLTEPE